MRALYAIHILNVKLPTQIFLLFTFISTTLFAHPHSENDLEEHPHTHNQNANDLYFQSTQPSSNTFLGQKEAKKKIILFDDNLYLLEDDFDFGSDEFELQKIEINADDFELAKEYENFLSSLYKDATLLGSKTSHTKASNHQESVYLYGLINNLESEKLNLIHKIENLKQQLESVVTDKDRRLGNSKIDKQILKQKIETLEKQLQEAINDQSYANLKSSYNNLKISYDNLNVDFDKLIKKSPPPPPDNRIHSSREFKYGISAILGATIPINQSSFSVGPNFGIRLDTPLSFNLAGMETKVGAEYYCSTMARTSELNECYFLNNIIGNVSIFPLNQMKNKYLFPIEIRSGLGLTIASISNDRKTTLSIHADINYYLPMELAGFKIGINLHSQLTMDHPIENRTTSFFNIGLLIKTPLQF